MERVSIDIGGPVSVLDYGGSGQLVVCVHGLEGSAYNWNLIGPELARTHRVVAPDLSGFGYTKPLRRGASVEANVELVAGLIEHFGGNAILIGNSMGGLISLLTAEMHPSHVKGLTLVCPAAPISDWTSIRPRSFARLSAPLIPGLGGRLVDAYRSTQTPEEGVCEVLDFVAADADALDPQVWDDALEMATLRRTQPWSTDALVEAVNSIAPYVLRRSRFAPYLHRLSQPTLLVHGMEDRLIQVQTARWMARQRPDWTTVLLEGVGHVPMLEVPDRLLAVFETWERAMFPVVDVSRATG